MSGLYSLVTGGQTFSGSFSYTLNEVFQSALTFNTLSVTGYPSTIQLSGLGNYIFCGSLEIFTSSGIVADVTASNGFEMKLSPGAETWACNVGYVGEFFTWSSPPVTATNVAGGMASITEQPQSAIVNAFSTASFSVTASGTEPLSYQCSFNGTSIAGATSSNLTIASVVQTNLGTYAVVVTNDFGTATSSNAVLSMYPYIAVPFAGAVTYWGQSNTLSVLAWGTGPLDYQWFDNGNAIAGATNQDLTLTTIQATNAGLYSVVVTSSLGSATNAPEQVVVEPAGVSIGGLYPGIVINGATGYNYTIESTADLTVC
jgi:hypothetical protein